MPTVQLYLKCKTKGLRNLLKLQIRNFHEILYDMNIRNNSCTTKIEKKNTIYNFASFI